AHDGEVADPLAFLSRRHVIVPSPREVARLRQLMEQHPSPLYVLLPTADHIESVLYRLRPRFTAPLAQAPRGEGDRPWTIHRLEPRRDGPAADADASMP